MQVRLRERNQNFTGTSLERKGYNVQDLQLKKELYARLERNPKITFEELTKGVEICKIKVFGKTLPELAKETGLKYMTLRRRLERNPDITLEELIRPVEKHIRS